MKLYFKYSNGNFIGNYAEMIYVSHNLESDIYDCIKKHIDTIKTALEINIERKRYPHIQKNQEEFYNNICKNPENIINYFEYIEIDNINDEILSKINHLLNKTEIPLVVDLRDKDNNYVYENIIRIDKILKENGAKKVSYKINQSVNEHDSHNEDISYELEDVLYLFDYINNIKDQIETYNLSNLEKIMYIYNLVKKKIYKEEKEDEAYLESRDIVKVLKGDKIVCQGFSQLFTVLLDSINIESNLAFISNRSNDSGHVRVYASVKDEKYNLNHIFFFDPTWDSKENENDFSDKYQHFAKPKSHFTKIDKKFNYKDEYLLSFDSKDTIFSFTHEYRIDEIERIMQYVFSLINKEDYFIDREVPNEYKNTLTQVLSDNSMIRYIDEDLDFLKFLYQECCEMLNRQLPDDVFIECLVNIKKLENHNQENIKDEILEICCKYFNIDNQLDKLLLISKINTILEKENNNKIKVLKNNQ